MDQIIQIHNVLISVSDKWEIDTFAHFLVQMGARIISTGGTAEYLKKNGIPVTEVEEITGFAEILDGRVKTLHPKIHGGILAKREEKHLKQLEQFSIQPIDLVVLNLYPFEKVSSETTDPLVLVENIDIGGPAMLRAAAKNHQHVAVVVDPADYIRVRQELEEFGGISLQTRKELALKAFAYTSYYDSLIYHTFQKVYQIPHEKGARITLPLRHVNFLRYGENPHQKASVYSDAVSGGNTAGLLQCEQLWGKELSFNNYLDLDAALQLSLEFDQPFACIIKHTNPCGAALGSSLQEAFSKALSGDPKSAFGGIIGLNQTVDGDTAKEIASSFFECVVAPDYNSEALDLLRAKKNIRLLKWNKDFRNLSPNHQFDVKKIVGGYLIQETDKQIEPVSKWELVAGSDYGNKEELDFAWRMVKHVKSNAIVLVKNRQLIGVGAGQMSRVDAVWIALQKAVENGFTLGGTILASDAFFPFADSLQLASEKGVTIFIEPGGSVRDEEVIEFARKNHLTLYFTHHRHFKH